MNMILFVGVCMQISQTIECNDQEILDVADCSVGDLCSLLHNTSTIDSLGYVIEIKSGSTFLLIEHILNVNDGLWWVKCQFEEGIFKILVRQLIRRISKI